MLNPEYQAMSLQFVEKGEDGVVFHAHAALADDDAGDLRTVLPAIQRLLVSAGFTYVIAVVVETDMGNMIFSDEA